MTTSVLSPLSMQTFFYENGAIVRPSRLFFYHPDTTDPLTVFTDHLLGIPHDVPVLSGGSGRVPPIYVGETPYRCRVYDSYGALVEDIPWLPGAVAPVEGGGGEPGEDVTEILTGDFVLSFSAGTRTGYVRANGGIIGSAGFSGSGYQVERLNADTELLFKYLWANSTNAILPVLPSRGASSNDDWLANKAITLPDLRGSTLTCIDGHGGPVSGTLAGVAFNLGNATSPGSYGGSAFTTQTIDQMPAHAHAMSLSSSEGAAARANSGGDETTTIATDYSGGGEPMQTISPFGLVAVYIKL